jgi:hypothetical protein
MTGLLYQSPSKFGKLSRKEEGHLAPQSLLEHCKLFWRFGNFWGVAFNKKPANGGW